MLIIELNEFDPVFLREEAKKLNLQNILYFLNLNHSETFTNEKKEHQGLDPWVQWVSIHTGKPLSQHKVKRLGKHHLKNKSNFGKKSLRLILQNGEYGSNECTLKR